MRKTNLWKRTLACVLGISMALGNTGSLQTVFAEEAETVSMISANEEVDDAIISDEPVLDVSANETVDDTVPEGAAIPDTTSEAVVIEEEFTETANESTISEEATVSEEGAGLIIEDIETVEEPGIAMVSEDEISTASVNITTAGTLSVGGSVTAVINEDNNRVIYEITVTESGAYRFYSESDHAVWAHLYDSNMEYLTSSNSGGQTTNFELKEYLTAGEIYYLSVSFFNNTDAPGSFPVYMVKYSGLAAIADNSFVKVVAGDIATLSVKATSDVGTVTYQWYVYDRTVGEDVDISGETGSSLIISDTSELEFESYCCKVTDGISTEIVYIDLGVHDSLHLYNSGDFIDVEPGGTVTLTVEAISPNTIESYTWYYTNTETGDYVQISGASTNVLQVENITSSTEYKCVVSDGTTTQSTTFQVDVVTDLKISKDFGTQVYIASGGSITLNVTATSSYGSISYQWYKSGVPIDGANSNTLTVSEAATYWCFVSDAYYKDYVGTTVYIETTPATEHQSVTHTAAKAATCAAAGNIEYWYCADCGKYFSDSALTTEVSANSLTIAKLTTHTYGAWTTTTAATALATGTQTRTCSICGKTETQTIAKLTPTITVNATSIKLKKKQSTTALKVSGLAAGDSVASWKSSNTKIVTVTSKGKITAKNKTGTAYITITLKSGLAKKVKVTVQSSAVKTTKITVPSKTVSIKKGKTYTIKPTISPITSVQKVTYSSSNKKVATVNSKGKITAKKKGTATITVKSGSKSVKIKVTVK